VFRPETPVWAVLAGVQKGIGVGVDFTTPTPPTPNLSPAAAAASKCRSGCSPPPESAVPPAYSSSPTRETFLSFVWAAPWTKRVPPLSP